MKAWRSQLIAQNTQLGGHKDGFLFSGEFFTDLPPDMQKQAVKEVIRPALRQEAKDYIREVRAVEGEKLRLYHGLAQLCGACQTQQDIRDALPEAAVLVDEELKALPRTREAGWTLRDKPLLAFDFKRTEELVDFYSAHRMIF